MKILFDASILAEGLHKTSNRSGIFWASYEIFRALDARNDVELGVYASPSLVDGVNDYLAETFPGRGYRVLNRARSCFLGPIKEWIETKKELPCNKAGLRKRVLQAAGMLAKIARVLWDKYVGCRKVAEIAAVQGTCAGGGVQLDEDGGSDCSVNSCVQKRGAKYVIISSRGRQ